MLYLSNAPLSMRSSYKMDEDCLVFGCLGVYAL